MYGTIINVGISAIFTEHIFTSFLSSPYTTQRFFAGDEATDAERETVRTCFMYAAGISIVGSIIFSYLTRNWWGLLVSLLLIGIFYYVYDRALRGEL